MTDNPRTGPCLRSQFRLQPFVRIRCKIQRNQSGIFQVRLEQVLVEDMHPFDQLELFNLSRRLLEQVLPDLIANSSLDAKIFDSCGQDPAVAAAEVAENIVLACSCNFQHLLDNIVG